MYICQALKDCLQLTDVIKLINKGGSSEADRNEIAAQYAYDAAENKEVNEIEYHLDYLVEHGAKFDMQKALEMIAK